MNVSKKTILVTGATGGIGSELSRLLAERGASLVLTCFNERLLGELQQKLGEEHHIVPADISSSEGRQAIASQCQEVGGVDAVINLAGILDFKLFEAQSAAIIEKILAVNLTAVMLLCHSLIPMLRNRAESAIVNVGSTFGSIGHPGFIAYCASKAGVRGFSEALSRELSDTPIQVSYIAPRATNTPLNNEAINALNSALGNKSDTPEYVARQIFDVLEHDSRVRYLGWPEKLFVRINAVFPRLVDNALSKKLSVIKQYAK